MRARALPVQHLLRGGYKRGLRAFQGADKGIMDALVHLRKERRAGGRRGRGEATVGESVQATLLWGSMLYADDVGVVSQSPEQPRKMMGVIVVVCATFGLTVSEAKTEIMCLRTKGMPESTAIQCRGSGPVVQPDERVCIPREERQPQ